MQKTSGTTSQAHNSNAGEVLHPGQVREVLQGSRQLPLSLVGALGHAHQLALHGSRLVSALALQGDEGSLGRSQHACSLSGSALCCCLRCTRSCQVRLHQHDVLMVSVARRGVMRGRL